MFNVECNFVIFNSSSQLTLTCSYAHTNMQGAFLTVKAAKSCVLLCTILTYFEVCSCTCMYVYMLSRYGVRHGSVDLSRCLELFMSVEILDGDNKPVSLKGRDHL